ncbi:MAG: hypothetical protein P4L92_17855 [Rudaea sp.]|nr:hypothetical protein [Rudaea sp.]
MAPRLKTPSKDQQALVDRLSRLSAERFNAVIDAYGDYQHHLNDWHGYESEIEFNGSAAQTLPNASQFFNFHPSVLKQVKSHMRAALTQLKSDGEDISDADCRHDAFTDAVCATLRGNLKSQATALGRAFDDIGTMDEEVYHGRLVWSMIKGAGKDLAAAAHVTREG